jgi:NADH-quinone oxidoreductase subunit M
MEWLNQHLISVSVLLPLAGAFLIFIFMRKAEETSIRWATLFIMLLGFVISLKLFLGYDGQSQQTMQFLETASWIPAFGIDYKVGMDGMSLLLIMLTTFLGPLVILCSWNSIQDGVKAYHISLLLLQTAMLGAFVSLNLFLFYIFWEAMLIPMYFIIGIWGGPRRIYAAVKFFLYTLTGSLLMLIAILYIYFQHYAQFGFYSFDLYDLYRLQLPMSTESILFLVFGLSFAIKVPMFPFHTWLPDAHVEAPTAGSVVLAGVLLKMGTYGFLRFSMPLFPAAAQEWFPLIGVLAVIGIIYGALVAMVQPDMKKLVAYSSVSHLGFVMLGLAALNTVGVEGSVIQMVNHGLSTGALFILVGMLYERRHTRLIADFGGIAKSMPVFAVFFMIVTLSSIGLPGLNGFVGEFLILLGTFKKSVPLGVLATSGVILAAVYMLWMFKRVMFGPLDKEENKTLKDLSPREIATLVPLVILIVWIGVYPQTFLRKMDRSVEVFLARTAVVQPAEASTETPGGVAVVEERLQLTIEPTETAPEEERAVAEPVVEIQQREDLLLPDPDPPQPDHGER